MAGQWPRPRRPQRGTGESLAPTLTRSNSTGDIGLDFITKDTAGSLMDRMKLCRHLSQGVPEPGAVLTCAIGVLLAVKRKMRLSTAQKSE
jgi:hypothetical protein